MHSGLYKREITSFFYSGTAYAVLGVYVLVSMLSAIFLGEYFFSADAAMTAFFAYQPQVLVMIVPAITMRCWAEEKKNGTIENLLTFPLSSAELVFAKFGAALTIVLMMLVFSLPLLLTSAIYIKPDWGCVFSSYLGFVFAGAAITALGCAISASTSLPIAAYLGAVICGILWVNFNFGGLITKIWVNAPFYFDGVLNFDANYHNFLNGQFNPASVVYFISITVLLLMCNWLIVAGWRTKLNKKTTVAIAGVMAWILLNLCVGRIAGGWGLDMTSAKKYTLDETTKTIVKAIDKPIKFKLYVGADLSSYSRDEYNYAQYVIEVLSQYQKLNHKQVQLEVVRVKPYSPEAKIAEEAGIKAIPYNDEYMYFGLQVQSLDSQRVMSELVSGRAKYFENDINRILSGLLKKDKTVIGIMAPGIPLFEKGGKEKVWSVIDELRFDYQLVHITQNATYIPTDVKVLIVLNPNELAESQMYALDQYLMYGGKLMVFVDPYSEIAHFYKGYPPRGNTNLKKMLAHWGVDYDYNNVVGSFEKSLKIDDEVRYPLWFFAEGEGYEKLHFRTAGALNVNSQNDVDYRVLVRSAEDSGMIDAELLRYASRKNVAEHLKSENTAYNLAVIGQGIFSSYFDHGYYDGTEYADEVAVFMPESVNGATLVVVADSDFVADDNWALRNDVENPIYGTVPYADNGEFLLSMIGNLAGEPKAAKLKYVNEHSIAEKVVEPYVEATAKLQSELKSEYNSLQEQLRNKQVLVNLEDTGKQLMLRKELNELEQAAKQKSEEISRLRKETGYKSGRAINYLLGLNLIVYPAIILLLLVLFFQWQRKRNLRGLK